MKKNDLIRTIETFAPLETQETWDNCGWQILTEKQEINKVMLCLSVTKNIIKQAKEQNCDMILAHHPLFYIPFDFGHDMAVYSAHTNLDKADGGTTDTIIDILGYKDVEKVGDFLRIVNDKIALNDLILRLKINLNLFNIRVANNNNLDTVSRIAFCAGSGSEFKDLAKENGADILITGDIKYHTALESEIILIDIGHFESEIPVLKTLYKLLQDKVEVVTAKETTPLKNY
ncbi:Nif3-like dinuclear metal center hexameric protein [bacterium]|nr:Nif3-like dinuclear metal center hexameric protein [bacterium]